MPVMQANVSVAAGGLNSNLFAGSAYEYARGRTLVSLAVIAEATGTFITIQSGADVVLEEASPLQLAANAPIIQPDHFLYNDVMEPFDRLKVQARNPTAGAVIHRAIALLQNVQ